MAELVEDPKMRPMLVKTISSLLQRAVDANDESSAGTRSAFAGSTKPAIGIRSYLARIAKYAGCSPACLVVAYLYLDRLSRRSSAAAVVGPFTVHRLLIAAVRAATKFLDDIYYNNVYFAKVGGISLAEMNMLEMEFLFGLQFELNVTPNDFSSCCTTLQREMYLDSPAVSPSPMFHCLPSEEPNNCKQKQLAV